MTMSIKSNNHHFEAYRVRNYPGIHGDLIGYNLIPGPSIVSRTIELVGFGPTLPAKVQVWLNRCKKAKKFK